MGTSNFTPAELRTLLPEILLALLGLSILAADLITPKEDKRSLGIFAASGLAALTVLSIIWHGVTHSPIGGVLQHDALALFFRALFTLLGTLTILMSLDYRGVRQAGEYYSLIVFATLGMSLVAATTDLVMLYAALELTDIALYLLTGFRRDDPNSSEAGLKYFLFGAFASAILLYGLSMIYGFTGSLKFEDIGVALQDAPPLASMVGLVTTLVGLGFKVAAVPMQFWVPDVYQGAPTPVAAFIATASKSAGFAVLMRILTFAFPGVAGERTALLMALSLLTMSVGNLMAIPQRNIKRLMGYSAIANAGYILIGVAAGESGLPAVVFCLTVYGVTNIAAFGVISLVSNVVGSDRLEAYTALNRRSSTLALALLAALLSLGGIPPLGGFMAKLFLFMAGVRSGLTWLVVAGLLNTILGLYYYLNVARILYRDPEGAVRDPIPIPRSSKVVITLSTGALVALGILAAPVYQIILSLFERWAQ